MAARGDPWIPELWKAIIFISFSRVLFRIKIVRNMRWTGFFVLVATGLCGDFPDTDRPLA
jgi:hypothetical protein